MQTDDGFKAPKIAVCVLTRLRAEGLTRTLEGIARQQISSHYFSRLRVIVVDNDPGGSGQPVCDRLRSTYPWTLDYAIEPIAGIPHARNRALEMALTEDDLMAFIDDDEVPSETWLAELLRVRIKYSADVVLGPVIPYFPDPVPLWIEQGAFFKWKYYPTGTVRTIGATGNVLMSTQMLKQSGIRFDEFYQFSGGSDSAFFRKVHQAGWRMIWAEEATAIEWVPKSRTTIRWLSMRHFRNGANRGRIQPIWRRPFTASIGMARVIFGGVCTVAFFPFGRHRSVKAIRWASYGMGLLYGVLGKHYQEYRKPRSL